MPLMCINYCGAICTGLYPSFNWISCYWTLGWVPRELGEVRVSWLDTLIYKRKKHEIPVNGKTILLLPLQEIRSMLGKDKSHCAIVATWHDCWGKETPSGCQVWIEDYNNNLGKEFFNKRNQDL